MKLLFLFAHLLLTAYARADDGFYSQENCDVSISDSEYKTLESKAKKVPDPNYHITFDLYTRKNINQRQILRAGDKEALINSNFDSKLPVRISIHGCTGRSTSCSNLVVKDAYLSTDDFNVILVDWSDVALNTDRAWIASQADNVAYETAELIKFLVSEQVADLSNTYLIGHDTGCQITGMVAKLIRGTIGAIIALDPVDLRSDNNLVSDDAWYVQSIHTEISLLNREGNKLSSHASFFPNWGRKQPQCETANDFQCNHFAAVQYFAESIRNPNLFGALECPTLSSISKYYNCECSSGEDTCEADEYMGGEELWPTRGYFYLSTESHPPYGLNGTVRIDKSAL